MRICVSLRLDPGDAKPIYYTLVRHKCAMTPNGSEDDDEEEEELHGKHVRTTTCLSSVDRLCTASEVQSTLDFYPGANTSTLYSGCSSVVLHTLHYTARCGCMSWIGMAEGVSG